jgi:hypothetical protein
MNNQHAAAPVGSKSPVAAIAGPERLGKYFSPVQDSSEG